ncbi:caspase family protein [Streptomyces phaeochromogenes]|uniref:VMAP-C domain-containing protein n=1 Tax=Streptomyces phaeochromogenes TaxID=1923 RepID=UPI00369BF203
MSEYPPERAFALVVGVETYRISNKWNLPGAASDALRFARWLTAIAKVPTGNVHLLVSPLSAQACTDGIDDGGLSFETATRESVEKTLFEDLPACDGDLLWIYWAGHGFLDLRHDLLLPYEDTTKNRPDSLNLSAALRWWRSRKRPSGRFGRVVALADTCRVAGPGLKLHSTMEADDGPDPRRRQFVLFAARPGQAAQNLDDRRAGQFTRVLLDRLEGQEHAASVTALPDTARQVQTDFQELRQKGEAWQEPDFSVASGWDDSPLFGDRQWGAEGTCLDQQAWTGLGTLLDRSALLPMASHEAYRWAFENTGCTAPAAPGLPADDLTRIAHDLDQRQGRQGSPPLTLPFFRLLAARARSEPSRRAWADEVDAWVDATAERLGVGVVPLAPPPPAEGTHLHVHLSEHAETPDTYGVRMWLHDEREGFTTLWESDNALPLGAVKTSLAEQLLQAVARSDPPSRIEFHVPQHLLHRNFASWSPPIGRRGRPVPLNSQYEVLLRCPEERDGVTRSRWEGKWQWFRAAGSHHSDAVRTVADIDLSASLPGELYSERWPVCALLDTSDPRLEDALDAVLEAGLPIAVWRPAPMLPDGEETDTTEPTADRADLRALHAELQGMDGHGPGVDRLAERVRSRAAAGGPPIGVLWDDPARIPKGLESA